jgi:hypothetical protein
LFITDGLPTSSDQQLVNGALRDAIDSATRIAASLKSQLQISSSLRPRKPLPLGRIFRSDLAAGDLKAIAGFVIDSVPIHSEPEFSFDHNCTRVERVFVRLIGKAWGPFPNNYFAAVLAQFASFE